MGLFESFREPGWNTYYEGKESVARVDVTQVFVFFFTAVLALVMIVLVIGSKGKEKWLTFLRVMFSLHTGVVIFICLTGQTWQVSSVMSHCEYVPVVPHQLSAHIGVIVGLKSVNITLKGEFNESTGQVKGRIYYNEIFSFDKASDMHDAFEEARERGLPWAILYILEYFKVDNGGLRWCRAFRDSGHFTFILLWCAFAAWCVANMQVGFAVLRGACMFVLSGVLMVTGCVLYHCLQPVYPFLIPFKDAYIELYYGWTFWLCLVSGSVTMISGLSVVLLHWWFPLGTATVFLHDEQMEGLQEELANEKLAAAEGPLNIGTPRTMRRASSRSYSNPSFADDMPPPYDESKTRRSMSVAEELGGTPWVRGARTTQSCGPPSRKIVTIAEEQSNGGVKRDPGVDDQTPEKAAKEPGRVSADVHRNHAASEFVIGMESEDEEMRDKPDDLSEQHSKTPSTISLQNSYSEPKSDTSSSSQKGSRKGSLADTYPFSDEIEEDVASYVVSDGTAGEQSVRKGSQLDAPDSTASDTASGSVKLKYSDEHGVSKAIIQLNGTKANSTSPV